MCEIFRALLRMKARRHRRTLGGFSLEGPDREVPELFHCGEYWVGSDHVVGDHRHAVWELYFQVEGVSHWAGPERTYTLRPGAFLAVAPSVPHRTAGKVRGHHHFQYAALDLRPILARHPGLRGPWRAGAILFHPRPPEHDGLAAAFRALMREAASPLRQRRLALSLAVDSLAVEATRLFLQEVPAPPSLPQHGAVWRARELLENQPSRRWTLARLAKAAGLSPAHLALRFRREVGIPPRQFLLRVRMERAKRLLVESSQPVTEIALEVGFSSSQHFAAAFRKLAGMSASAYRQRFKPAGSSRSPRRGSSRR
jgi:AraC family transcriptional regulator